MSKSAACFLVEGSPSLEHKTLKPSWKVCSTLLVPKIWVKVNPKNKQTNKQTNKQKRQLTMIYDTDETWSHDNKLTQKLSHIDVNWIS